MGAARSKTVAIKNSNQTSPTMTGTGLTGTGFPGGLPSPFLNDFGFPQLNPSGIGPAAMNPFNQLNGLNNLPSPPLNPNLNPLAIPPGLNNMNPLACAAAIAAAIGINNQVNPLQPPSINLPSLGCGINPGLNQIAGLNSCMNPSINPLAGINGPLNGALTSMPQIPPLSQSPTNQMANLLSPTGLNQNQAHFASNLNDVASASQLNNSNFMNSFSTGQLSPLNPANLSKQMTVPQPFPQIQPFPQPFPQPVPVKVAVPVPVEIPVNIPIPVAVPVDKPVPVAVPVPVPVPVQIPIEMPFHQMPQPPPQYCHQQMMQNQCHQINCC